jgi:hypothetical protein
MKKTNMTVVILFAAFLVSCADQSAEHTRRAATGQPILSAIYQFKQDTGAYPTNLSVLVPKYLKTAPDVDWMGGWDYGPADYQGLSNGFKLSRFSVGYKTRIEYIDDGSAAGWRVNAEGTKTPLNLPDPRKPSNKPSEATSQ